MSPSALRTTLTAALLAGATAAAVVGTASSGSAADDVTGGSGRTLTATLVGSNEVPVGDLAGSGRATVTINPGRRELCYSLAWAQVGQVVAAHIHQASAGTNGKVIVPLVLQNTPGKASGCTTVARQVLVGIITDPTGYYVNFHTAAFPGGAIRGQLTR